MRQLNFVVNGPRFTKSFSSNARRNVVHNAVFHLLISQSSNKLLATLSSYNKITLHTVMTWPEATICRFKIWNPIFVVSAMHDNVRLEALCVDAANRHELQWRHIRNKLICLYRTYILLIYKMWKNLVSYIDSYDLLNAHHVNVPQGRSNWWTIFESKVRVRLKLHSSNLIVCFNHFLQ